MMNPIDAVPQHLLREPAEKKAKEGMGKDDFMTLLMAQLRNQDPINPVDNQAFATQLAQFSQLEQLSNIGSGIKGLRTGQGEESKLQALSMIGKKVQAAGNEIQLVSGQPVSLNPTAKEGVKLTGASIFDSNGKLVREIDLTRRENDESIVWDGKTSDGLVLPSGKYSFRARGVGPNGESQEVGTELSGRVVGVDFENNAPVLLVEAGTGRTRLELGKVRQVDVSEDSAKTSPTKPGEKKSAPSVVKTEPVKEAEEAIDENPIMSMDLSELLAGREVMP